MDNPNLAFSSTFYLELYGDDALRHRRVKVETVERCYYQFGTGSHSNAAWRHAEGTDTRLMPHSWRFPRKETESNRAAYKAVTSMIEHRHIVQGGVEARRWYSR